MNNYFNYIIKRNDNLYDIANKFNTTVGILKAFNNLSSNILQVGQILKIPNTKVEQSNPSDYIIYTIKKGDNLYSIAKRFNISLNDLINFNEMSSTLLTIGDELLIPTNNSNLDITYIVKPNDTLYSIAKRYNISINMLKNKNNLENNMLQIGQKLIIPNTSNYMTYVVRTNDNLDSIANKTNTSKESIRRLNNLLNDEIVVGQILLIPNN
ncbi:MAG: LysM peptidoglycan-binding domain-containing protein [Bacilli bacterium]|nr:LysM peptidoglycan-binding domain-containing protein [Bacilli bacterium]